MAFEPFHETLDIWKQKTVKLDFQTVKEIFVQIIKGLAYCHSKNFIHGNLTSSQIVIFQKENSLVVPKISKFQLTEGGNSTN